VGQQRCAGPGTSYRLERGEADDQHAQQRRDRRPEQKRQRGDPPRRRRERAVAVEPTVTEFFPKIFAKNVGAARLTVTVMVAFSPQLRLVGAAATVMDAGGPTTVMVAVRTVFGAAR